MCSMPGSAELRRPQIFLECCQAFVLIDIKSCIFSAWCAVCLLVEHLELVILNCNGPKC